MSKDEIVNLRVIEDAVSEMNQELTFWINTYKKDKGKLEKQLKNVIEQVMKPPEDFAQPEIGFLELRECRSLITESNPLSQGIYMVNITQGCVWKWEVNVLMWKHPH